MMFRNGCVRVSMCGMVISVSASKVFIDHDIR